MRISIDWLEDFLSLYISADELAEEIRGYDGLKAVSFKENQSGPSGDHSSLDEIVIAREKLLRKWRKKSKRVQKKILIIEDFMESIESPPIREIIRMRYLKKKEWEEVGKRFRISGEKAHKILEDFLENNK